MRSHGPHPPPNLFVIEWCRQYCTGKITLQFVGKNTDANVEKMEVLELDWKKYQLIFTQLNFVTKSQVDKNCLIVWSVGLLQACAVKLSVKGTS